MITDLEKYQRIRIPTDSIHIFARKKDIHNKNLFYTNLIFISIHDLLVECSRKSEIYLYSTVQCIPKLDVSQLW